MPPQHIDRYHIRSEIGHGSMAVVYWAYDQQNSRNVALKVLHTFQDTNLRKRFRREVKTIAKLNHPAIIPIYHAAQVGNQLFFAMPLMQGGSLAERLRSGALPIDHIVGIIARLTAALDFAHHQGVIHRDIKPENILFDKAGNAFLTDFGIAKLHESEMTLTGTAIVGTPAYMSPEQVQGDKALDGRSDLYALGIVLFEMLTGSVPYKSDTAIKTAMKHLVEPIPRVLDHNHGLSKAWQHTINRALAKDPAKRYQTGQEMLKDVVAASQGKNNAPIQWKKWAIGVAATLILLSILLLGWAWLQQSAAISATAEPTATQAVAIVEQATEQIVPTAVNPTTSPSPAPTTQPAPTNAPPTATLPPATLQPNTTTATPRPYQVAVNVNSANVRTGPNILFPDMEYVFKDQKLPVIAQDRNAQWLLVALPNGRSGWISTRLVTILANDNLFDIPIAATIPPLPTTSSTATPDGSATPANQPLQMVVTVNWQPAPDNPEEAIGSVHIQASGGDHNYTYYRDDIQQNGAQFTYRWRVCQTNPVSFRVDSGDGQTMTVTRVERPLCTNATDNDQPEAPAPPEPTAIPTPYLGFP